MTPLGLNPKVISFFGESTAPLMREFMSITKALADESRVRILLALEGGELCVCQITELLELAPSTISKHLSILYQARLVDSRKDGRWIYYTLAKKPTPPGVREAINWVIHAVAKEPRIAQDAAQLKKILALDPGELCKAQCRG